MKKVLLSITVFGILPFLASAQMKVNVSLDTTPEKEQIIPKEIYGQFAEHLGSCIYGGLWVGPESDIPNIEGYRTDVLQALKELKVPVMRWPGGCFADEYHWMDGIGPRKDRPRMVNSSWGGTVEDNSFGTHEFLNLCEMLGCEPYISGNVGSGSVEELAKWVEYMTAADGPMAKLRAQNGRKEPWKVKYLGVGNESWGCGGNMVPEYYSHLYRRYQTYCRNFSGNRLYKVASGASDYDYNWTEVLMKNVGDRMHGLSLHYYTVKGWNGSKGSATRFSEEEYYNILGKAVEVEPVIARHIAIIDAYEAMTSARSYRKSLSPLEVVERFEASGMMQYDYDILRPLMIRIADTQLGMTAKLSDDTVWEIFLPNSIHFSKPTLKRENEKGELELLDLSQRKDLKIVSIY